MAVSPARARKLYGKYRGKVVDNVDPSQRGRVRVSVPGVLSARTAPWAELCLPVFAGLTSAPPAIGSSVLVEFEAGDARRPICSGRLWSGQDEPGGRDITLHTVTGATIAIGEAGITISNGQGASITLNGPNVSINNGALVVM